MPFELRFETVYFLLSSPIRRVFHRGKNPTTVAGGADLDRRPTHAVRIPRSCLQKLLPLGLVPRALGGLAQEDCGCHVSFPF